MERMCRVDRERRQHRENLDVEDLAQLVALAFFRLVQSVIRIPLECS